MALQHARETVAELREQTQDSKTCKEAGRNSRRVPGERNKSAEYQSPIKSRRDHNTAGGATANQDKKKLSNYEKMMLNEDPDRVGRLDHNKPGRITRKYCCNMCSMKIEGREEMTKHMETHNSNATTGNKTGVTLMTAEQAHNQPKNYDSTEQGNTKTRPDHPTKGSTKIGEHDSAPHMERSAHVSQKHPAFSSIGEIENSYNPRTNNPRQEI